MKQLARNVSRKDKNIRIGLGIALLLIGVIFGGGWLLSLLGIALIVTGALSTCWLYSAFGFSTATPEEQAVVHEDMKARVIENLSDFKTEAITTAGNLKETSHEKIENFKQSERGQKTQEKIEALKENAGHMIDHIKSDEFKESTKEKLHSLKAKASELFTSAKEKISKTKDNTKP